jgi:hypothetical protein
MKTSSRLFFSLLLAAAVPMVAVSDDDDRRGYGYGMMGPGMMQGDGYGMMRGSRGYGYGMGRGYYDEDYEPVSQEKAKELFEKFMAKHLKGFKITKIVKERMPMGPMYWAIVKDKNGNEFELHLNPHGYIRGPFVR